MKYCIHCGQSIEEDAHFCIYCGAQQQSDSQATVQTESEDVSAPEGDGSKKHVRSDSEKSSEASIEFALNQPESSAEALQKLRIKQQTGSESKSENKGVKPMHKEELRSDTLGTNAILPAYLYYIRDNLLDPQVKAKRETSYFGYFSFGLLALLFSLLNLGFMNQQIDSGLGSLLQPNYATGQAYPIEGSGKFQFFCWTFLGLLGLFALIIFIHYLFINFVYKKPVSFTDLVGRMAAPCSLTLVYMLLALVIGFFFPAITTLLTIVGFVMLCLSLQITCLLVLVNSNPTTGSELNTFYVLLISQVLVLVFLLFTSSLLLFGLLI